MLRSRKVVLKFSGGALHGREWVADPARLTSDSYSSHRFQEVQRYYNLCQRGKPNTVITLIPDYPTEANWQFESIAHLDPYSQYQVTACYQTQTSVTVYLRYCPEACQSASVQPTFWSATKLAFTLVLLWMVEKWALSLPQWLGSPH